MAAVQQQRSLLDVLDARVVDVHREVTELQQLLDAAIERRAIIYARANETGRSSGDIARMLPLGVLPHHIQPVLRVGRGLLAVQRRRAAGSRA